MDRVACVSVPALALQCLLLREPTWREFPVAVVDEDKPQGVILWANRAARQFKVLPGMRYAAALSLARALRASVVAGYEVQEAASQIADLLRHDAPSVEVSTDEPGLFWLDASGLERLYPVLDAWGWRMHTALAEAGYYATVAIGHTRFGAFAVARAYKGVTFLATPEEEYERTAPIPLLRLGISPKVRDRLGRLGIKTIAHFRGLPESGLRARFGEEVYRLHQMAKGTFTTPLRTDLPSTPLAASIALDFPDPSRERLLHRLEELLEELRVEALGKQRLIRGLRIDLRFDAAPPDFVTPSRHYFSGGAHPPESATYEVAPASPTLDAPQLFELMALRFAEEVLPAGVVQVTLTLDVVRASASQMELYFDRPMRDIDAANRALARIRATFGPLSVQVARLREGHLPEAQFEWRPLSTWQPPAPKEGRATLIRRILKRPILLPPRPRHLRDEGWLVRDQPHGTIEYLVGPFVISGGWWRGELHRAYHYAYTERGDILWVYYDQLRRSWFRQGVVL